ncbi:MULTISPECIES: K(+)-transporting ATPase subunit F [Allochromatium]|uniref:K+-transporting ATPase, F subunit n=2 Tax=Allochromatium TaxID=85072 RepID=D3RSD7_ALLVD|nr:MULTISPECIES: K(+)-transporting ATPase subunit F [Allochromatium]ADC62096.1 K+-transporting ATPase, F subunit [Allochromatium vinosum DSM 180]NVZ08918.1 K(+)-transporting ATPase subunit F [Allochromatium humboldtianum]
MLSEVIVYSILLVIVLALLVYLSVALLRPERF